MSGGTPGTGAGGRLPADDRLAALIRDSGRRPRPPGRDARPRAGGVRRLADVEVRLHPGGARVVSSPRGQFSFRGLTAGSYWLAIGPGTGDHPMLAVEVPAGGVAVVEVGIEAPDVTRLERVVVCASRYELLAATRGMSQYLPVERIESLPDLGDDPLRAVARLPGTASNGITAKAHLRGGARDETLVLFDDLRLRDPFHLKDFQSIFSAVDPAIIGGMEICTGALPPRYGDRLSGAIAISSLVPPVRPRHEASLSLFNSSLMSAGSMDDGRVEWAGAIRRGNLDSLGPRVGLVLQPDPRTAIRASWGRFFQSQGIDELQVSDGVTHWFRPERADRPVLSLEHRTAGGTEFRAEAYTKDTARLRPRFENLLVDLVLLPELKPDRIRLDPRGGRARGIEVSVARRDGGPLGWWLSYAWSEVEDEFGDTDVRRAWDPQHALQGGLEWRHGPWELVLAGSYHSGWPTTEVFLQQLEPVPVAGVGPRNARRPGSRCRPTQRAAARRIPRVGRPPGANLALSGEHPDHFPRGQQPARQRQSLLCGVRVRGA